VRQGTRDYSAVMLWCWCDIEVWSYMSQSWLWLSIALAPRIRSWAFPAALHRYRL